MAIAEIEMEGGGKIVAIEGGTWGNRTPVASKIKARVSSKIQSVDMKSFLPFSLSSSFPQTVG